MRGPLNSASRFWQLLVCVSGLVSPAQAQVLKGVVLADSGHRPVESAMVTLLDTSAAVAGIVRSGSDGTYRIRVPQPGYFALRATLLGYRPKVTNWIEVGGGDTIYVELWIERVPVRLQAAIVEAQRDSIRNRPVLGMNARSLGGTIITPAEIEAHVPGASNFTDVIGAQGIVGIAIKG